MTRFICRTCGVEHRDTDSPEEVCAICVDERQYVPEGGQRWATPDELAAEHAFSLDEAEPDLFRITPTPRFGIGQQTLLVRTPRGNLLWEPSGVVTDDLVQQVRDLGGIAGVAASHPHLVGASATWARTFGVPFWFNADDRRWLRSDEDVVRWWTDEAEPLPGLRLVQAGGHFPGSAVLLWSGGADGRGEILTGDTLMVGADRASVSFMRSYPNYLPLAERHVRRIQRVLEGLDYDRIRSGFDVVVETDGPEVVRRSADRYVAWITDAVRDPDERV